MKNVLEELYYGELYPNEQIVPDSKEYHETRREVDAIHDKLEKTLDEEQMGLVDQLLDLEGDITNIERLETFKYGFSLGMQLRQEVTENPYWPKNDTESK